MKKTHTIAALSFVMCVSFFIPDARDNYTGNYVCQEICSKMDMSSKSLVTSNNTVNVEILKDSLDSVLQIKINSNIFKVKLTNKDLRPFLPSVHYGGNFFSTDSLNFILSVGRAQSCKYVGKKI